MSGFSLRAWDADAGHWSLLLFWTTDGRGGFGTLTGEFRHGRGEFFSGSKESGLTRYSFSDALPDTVRWDSARSTDGGITWKTDWIMEFSRERSAAETTEERLFAVDWTSGELSPYEEARELDWMLGRWEGESERGGTTYEARFACKLLDKDCLVLGALDTRAPGADDWDERVTVRGFEARSAAWASYSVGERDPVIRRWNRVAADDGAFVSERVDADGARIRERIRRTGERSMAIEYARADGEGEVLLERFELQRRGE